MRVLVVEDDPRLAGLLSRWLRENAWAVDVAPSGEIAITEAVMTAYDVIILDIMLPKASGLEVCAELRRRGIRTPILMLTARDTITDRVAGLDTGADDYL